jgi:hypothetical protein
LDLSGFPITLGDPDFTKKFIRSMKTLLPFLLFSFFFVSVVKAQQKTNGFVYDINTKQPIPFATIKSIKKKTGFYANEKGEIISEINKGDTIIISCVGYEDKKVIVSASVDTFFLIPKQIILKEVLVSNLGSPEISIGLIDKKTGFSISSQVFSELALKISLPRTKEYYTIRKILLKGKKIPNNEDRIRLHVYKPDKSGFPGEEILPRDILINDYSHKKGVIEIDISNLDLYIEDEFIFIGFEFIGQLNKEFLKSGPKIEFTWANTEPISYSRTLLDPEHKWYIMDAKSPWAAHHKIKEQVPNIMASIIIQ